MLRRNQLSAPMHSMHTYTNRLWFMLSVSHPPDPESSRMVSMPNIAAAEMGDVLRYKPARSHSLLLDLPSTFSSNHSFKTLLHSSLFCQRIQWPPTTSLRVKFEILSPIFSAINGFNA